MKAITIKDFSPELHRAMKIQAAKEGITLKILIEKAMQEYIERYEAKENKRGR
jgi:predicted HicB family RNase H-like nuclease